MDARIKEVVIRPMASGHLSLVVSHEVGWEEFPAFANRVLERLGAVVVDKIEAVDIRIWKVTLSGCPLQLVYEDYPLTVSFESSSTDGDQLIHELKQRLDGLRG